MALHDEDDTEVLCEVTLDTFSFFTGLIVGGGITLVALGLVGALFWWLWR